MEVGVLNPHVLLMLRRIGTVGLDSRWGAEPMLSTESGYSTHGSDRLPRRFELT